MKRQPIKRRTLFRAVLGAAAVAAFTPRWGRAATAVAASSDPVAGSGTAGTWKWVALPNSGGLQVHCVAPAGMTSVRVRWTAEGLVTAEYPAPLTVSAPAGPGAQSVAVGPGYGLTLRRAA